MKKLFFILLTAFAVPVLGTNFVEIDTTRVVPCCFSSRHHNRIAVSNGRIKKIIFPEGEISVRIEEETGQAFIQTISNYTPVTTISIVTDEGDVQDIELTFSDGSAEILILSKTEGFSFDPQAICYEETSLCNSPFSAVIQQIMSGETPAGYAPGNNQKCCKKIKKGVIARLTKCFVSCREEIYVWRVSNCSKQFQSVCESEVILGNPDWIFLDKQELCPGESTMAITAVSRK